jgi:hypothetical protein
LEMYGRNCFEKTGKPTFFKKEKMCSEIVCTMIFLIYVMATAVKRILLSVSSILKP